MSPKGLILFLFDVDGTLTPSREQATEEMIGFLGDLKKKVKIGFVGGSDLPKQQEQLGNECVKLFDYCFPENGLHYIKEEKKMSSQSYLKHVGEEEHQKLVNRIMEVMSKIHLPIKRGSFIELRTSMVNISPIGRSCSPEERKEFCEYDKGYKIRESMVKDLEKDFPNLSFSIGGEISIDIFPKNWDKTYCLSHLEKEGIDRIYFFGDMTHPGGNDFEIANDPRVISTTVTSPKDTMEKVSQRLKEIGLSE